MPNIATILKDEIRRLARREIKSNTASTKGAVAQFRRDIARLKRQLRAQEKEIAFLKSQEKKRLGQPQTNGNDELEGIRHSARSVRSQRRRLKLSAEGFGKLVGVSGITIYNWEQGKVRPRQGKLATLVAVRNMGRGEALAMLEAKKAEKRAVKKIKRKPR